MQHLVRGVDPDNLDQSGSPSTAGADASRGSCSTQSCHSCRASANPCARSATPSCSTTLNAQRSCSFRAFRRRSQGYVTQTVPPGPNPLGVRPRLQRHDPANHVPPNAEDVETAMGNRRVFQKL